MTREQAQKEREAFNAFCEGKEIQERLLAEDATEGDWYSSDFPCFTSAHEHRCKRIPTMISLGPEDVPPGSVIREHRHDRPIWDGVIAIRDCGLFTTNMVFLNWSELRAGFDISRDQGKTWQRCEKEQP